MKTITILLFLLLCGNDSVQSQTTVTNNGILKLSSTTDTFFVAGSFINSSTAQLINEGSLVVQSNLVDSQSTNLLGNGTIVFIGANNQSLYSINQLNNITINKSAGSLTLLANSIINGVLKLTNSTSKLSIGNNTLFLNGSIDATSNGFITGSSISNITIEGSGSFGTLKMDQSSNGITNTVHNFTVNRAAQTITIGNILRVVNVLTPTAGTIVSSGNLVIASSANNTARIAAVNSSNYITGDVTVERYMSILNNRAYRLITPTVTTTSNIRSNWQEGVNNTSVSVNIASATPGYGTHITGAGGSSNGFDATSTNSASLFTYSYGASEASDQWLAVTNTNIHTLNATKGYLIFLRGNRDNLSTINTTTGSSNTVLRAKGSLIMGDYNFTNLQSNGRFSLIANPYASPILWDNSSNGLYTGNNANNFENYITIWDPNIGSRGGFVTITDANIAAGGTTTLTNEIQSGQAFFVQAKTGINNPTFSIKETNKSTTNNLNVYRSGTQTEILKTLLYYTDNTGVVRNADGVTSVFNNNYNNEVDANDAQQMANWDEDVAIKRNGYYLSIESRKLAEANDTIFLAVARLKTQNYTWKFVPKSFNAPNLQAQLKDNFTNTVTNISFTDTTVIHFAATTNAASKAENRFYIVFKSNEILPVTIHQLQAVTKNNGVQVQWQASNEVNIHVYEVEKSTDAVNFSFMQVVPAVKANQYQCFDAQPTAGNMYYRIKVVEKSGYSYYSSIVKVAIASNKIAISVYPNPVVGNQLAVQFNNLPTGTYQLNILNTAGLLMYSKNIHHLGGSANHQIQLNNALQTSGMYQLVLMKDDIKLIQSYIKQ